MMKLLKTLGRLYGLLSELEREQPESMFTATALTFVPIGLLREI